MNGEFIEICYGKKETFPESKRAERINHYISGAMACEGSEAERYTKMYSSLMAGKKVNFDLYIDEAECYARKFPELAEHFKL